jgi:hypothetical protein
MPYLEPSRPIPLSFMPPKGAISVEMMPSLMPTNAVFEGLGDAPDAADVTTVEIGEPEFGVVGHLDRLVFALEAVERGDGAKVSSFVMTMSVVTSVKTVGSKKGRRAPAAGHHLGAPPDRVRDMRLDLLDRLHVDQRSDHRTRLEPVGDLHRTGGLGQPLCKSIIDAVLHQDAVGADAGLAGVAVFRGDRTLDRHLDIGVVEDDERRVAAQFQRQFLACRRTPPSTNCRPRSSQ